MNPIFYSKYFKSNIFFDSFFDAKVQTKRGKLISWRDNDNYYSYGSHKNLLWFVCLVFFLAASDQNILALSFVTTKEVFRLQCKAVLYSGFILYLL